MSDDKNRKAKIGGRAKWLNLPKNWLHQALTYMDTGEKVSRIIIEALQISLISALLFYVLGNWFMSLALGFLIVHTWNWVTNCLFWSILIFAFPSLKNPGVENTVKYMNDMRSRLLKSDSVAALAIYGSVSRGAWHDRSDIDIRILRRKGFFYLIQSVSITIRERFIAFLFRQPMDLYLADGVDFMLNMREDEIPIFLIKRSYELDSLYPENEEQCFQKGHLSKVL